MVRTVKAPATAPPLKKGERAVLIPGATAAEPWELWRLGASVQCLGILADPQIHGSPAEVTLALPVAQVFCVPLWINETDAKLIPGIIDLQLELRGLHPRQASVVFDWSVVVQEETRTLVVVGILPGTLPPGIIAGNYRLFDLSARYLSLPEDSLILWREQDRLVLALTRGRALIYFQALSEAQISARLLQDINCIRATLAMQAVLPTIKAVTLWYAAAPAEMTALKESLQLPVRQMERPAPKFPSASWKLVPATVNEIRKTREIRRWRTRAAIGALVLYFLIILGLGARYFFLSHQVADLRGWQAEHTQAITLVRDTQAAWKSLQPALDRDSYPLELLLHASEAIPREDLHLTLFEISNDHVLIKGEAKDVSAAFKFFDQLKKDPHFAGYGFEMPQPHLLPNDLAQFQIDGSRPEALSP